MRTAPSASCRPCGAGRAVEAISSSATVELIGANQQPIFQTPNGDPPSLTSETAFYARRRPKRSRDCPKPCSLRRVTPRPRKSRRRHSSRRQAERLRASRLLFSRAFHPKSGPAVSQSATVLEFPRTLRHSRSCQSLLSSRGLHFPFGHVCPLPSARASRVNRKPRFPLKVSPNFPV